MEIEHHRDLAREFPDLKQRIHELKLADPVFRELYREYQEVDDEVYRIEQDIEARSDEYTENLKRRRVHLKDQLYAMLTGRDAAIGEDGEHVVRQKFRVPIDHGAVAREWIQRGYSCRGFVDPPGQEWRDFVHETNELVTVVEGRLEVQMLGERHVLEPGDELFIPRSAIHTVRNIHDGTTRWLYGYD
jgi:uncharacterized protein YdcH (DUF465 family)/quercetin dioxygenase-like cupin family protein